MSPSFQLSLPIFEGEVDDLLRLMSQRKIAPAEVRVADLTAQFRSYLCVNDTTDLETTGHFISASARILALKSADLLAQEDEPPADDGPDVVHRVPEIELLRASLLLKTFEGMESFTPERVPNLLSKDTEPRSATLLTQAWEGLSRRSTARVKRLAVPSFVKLEAALSTMIRRLRAGGSLSFNALVRGASRQDAVVHFISVLELVRRRQARAMQHNVRGDITVEWIEGGEGASQRAG